MTIEQKLASGLAELGIDLSPTDSQRLLDYVAVLHKWNRVYNLTAVREPQKMLTHHILDSLAALPLLTGSTVLDVGSGGGLPGVPIAIARPDCQVTLLDSNHKKTTFLRQAAIQLGLANVTVVCERVEAFRPQAGFDCVVSRAFSDLADFLRLAAHLAKPGGRFLAMKGLYPYEEVAQVAATYGSARVVPLTVPGLDAQRHAVIIDKGNP